MSLLLKRMRIYLTGNHCRTSDVTCSLRFPDGVEGSDEKQVFPGDNVEMIGELVHPIALEPQQRITLREVCHGLELTHDCPLIYSLTQGGRTVGTGLITRIL